MDTAFNLNAAQDFWRSFLFSQFGVFEYALLVHKKKKL